MLNPFLPALLLAFEAQKVIELRLVRIVGRCRGQAELVSMVGEKVVARDGGCQHADDGR